LNGNVKYIDIDILDGINNKLAFSFSFFSINGRYYSLILFFKKFEKLNTEKYVKLKYIFTNIRMYSEFVIYNKYSKV